MAVAKSECLFYWGLRSQCVFILSCRLLVLIKLDSGVLSVDKSIKTARVCGAKSLCKHIQSSVGMQLSVLQPFWEAMILFCWNLKPFKLPSVMLAHVCGTNSYNRPAKCQPRVGVVEIFCVCDSSDWKSFRLHSSVSNCI